MEPSESSTCVGSQHSSCYFQQVVKAGKTPDLSGDAAVKSPLTFSCTESLQSAGNAVSPLVQLSINKHHLLRIISECLVGTSNTQTCRLMRQYIPPHTSVNSANNQTQIGMRPVCLNNRDVPWITISRKNHTAEDGFPFKLIFWFNVGTGTSWVWIQLVKVLLLLTWILSTN